MSNVVFYTHVIKHAANQKSVSLRIPQEIPSGSIFISHETDMYAKQ